MKIVHVISDLDLRRGGPQAVAVNLAAAQAALRCEVVLCAYSDDGAPSIGPGTPGIDRVRIVRLGRASLIESVTVRRARQLLRDEVLNASIVHLHGVWEPLLITAARIAFDAQVPYVVSPHGMLKSWALNVRPSKKRLALSLGVRSMLSRAAMLHVLNEQEAQLPAAVGSVAHTVIVPNGTWPTAKADLPSPGSFRARFPELGADPYILFLSRVEMHKGLDLLLDAFAEVHRRVPAARLVVAGPPSETSDWVSRRAAELNLADRVHLVGGMFGPSKLACLSEAAVFCLPSRNEGYPVAVLDALALGTPSVISDHCFFPEVASSGSGRVVPLEAGALADALAEVLSNPELRQSMSRSAVELVQSGYTWSSVASRMLGAYRDSMRDDPRAATDDAGS